jgi:hypothetical protein
MAAGKTGIVRGVNGANGLPASRQAFVFRGSKSPNRTGNRLRDRRIGFGALGICLLLTGLVWAVTEPQGRDVVELEDVHAQVRVGRRLAYEIVADRGFYATSSRIVTLSDPRIHIFNEKGELQDRVSGREGRMWPVPAVTVQDDGTVLVVTKYNWSLSGDVVFHSSQGHLLKTPELYFEHETSEIRSESGLSYVIPSGSGGVFEGTAREFRSVMGGETSRLQNWTLSGQVQLTLKNVK